MRFDCIPPEFSPFRNFKKNNGKLNSLTVRKKKKKLNDPIFRFWSGEGNITIFFLALHQKLTKHDCRSKEKPIDFRNMENGQIHRIH